MELKLTYNKSSKDRDTMEVLIAEDHILTANLLADMLSKSDNIDVVGVVSNGYSVLDMISKKNVDVCLMDISMPYLDGIRTLEELLKIKSNVKVLVLSAHTEKWVIEKTLNLGAKGYLTKKVDTQEVVEALKCVFSGEQYLDETSQLSLRTNGNSAFKNVSVS